MRSVSQGQGRNNSGVSVSFRPQGKKPMTPRQSFGGKQKQASAAAAYATGQRSQPPSIVASRDSSRIVHRELVGSITGSTAFSVVNELALNPGIAATFPWLSSQALAWEQYRFNKLRFCYYTRTGSSTPGSMLLVPDYDAADAAPGSEQIASSYEDVAEDAPWKDICCELRPSAMHSMGPKKYVRTGPLAANLDIKTYDAGNLFPCTTDGTAVSWGKLWVEYDVSLFVPQLPPVGLPSSVATGQHFPPASNLTPTTANMLGATPTSNGSALVTVAGSVVTFVTPGNYLLSYTVTGGTSTGANPVIGAGGTALATFGLPLGAGQSVSGSGNPRMTINVSLSAVAGTTVTYNNTLAAGTNAELIVLAQPTSLV